MTIQRRPKLGDIAAQDAFIGGAPDAAKPASVEAPAPNPNPTEVYEKGVQKGNKRQITLTIAPDLLRKVDEVAKRTGQARAAVINLAIFRAIEGDIFQGQS
jgi:hypothetical protein